MASSTDKPGTGEGARSRLDTSRRTKIAKMVDGYSSTITSATALRNLFHLWLIPTGLLVVLGVFALGRRRGDDSWVIDAVGSVQAAVLVLWILTLVACIVYGAMNWSNVRCVGKSTKFGFVSILARHLKAFLGGLLLVLVGGFIPGLGPALLVAGIGLVTFGSMVLWAVSYGLVKMFWRAGSPPIGTEESLPHWAVGWFAALLAFSTMTGYSGVLADWPLAFALLTTGAGLSGFVSAALAGRLVMSISQRLDARMVVILERLDDDPDEKDRLVTTKQLEAAWDSSESLVSFDHLSG